MHGETSIIIKDHRQERLIAVSIGKTTVTLGRHDVKKWNLIENGG